MKKMRLLSLAVAAVLCAGFVSCSDDDDEPQNPAIENTGGTSDANGTITLVGTVAEAVELGLPSGLLWASWNVGASGPEGYGYYYAWGEIEKKDCYDWSTYKWCNGSDTTMTKYCTNCNSGIADNKTELELGDDVARMMWGDGWRMPTKEDMEELIDNCTWMWTTFNGINGYKVTSNVNGNSIFLPAAGYCNGTSTYGSGSYGLFWGRELGSDGCGTACVLGFSGSGHVVGYGGRCNGQSVRPVKEK